MANQTITFNQPGIKIFMTDDYSFLDGMASNTLTVDIRNTGENYIVLPGMFRVTDKNGNHPSGSTTNGTYFTESQANDARAVMINSVYGGNEYTISQDNYRSILRGENSDIWDDFGDVPEQNIVYYISPADKYGIGDINSTDSDWPSSINSDGLWFTGYDYDTDNYICQKVTDWNTYSNPYYQFMYNYMTVGLPIGDLISTLDNYYGISQSDLYNIMSSWVGNNGISYDAKLMAGLAYIGYGQTETENVGTSDIYDSSAISSSSIRFDNIQFRYNGAVPSRIFYVGGAASDWRVIKAIANARTDQGTGNTESVIIVEKLQ